MHTNQRTSESVHVHTAATATAAASAAATTVATATVMAEQQQRQLAAGAAAAAMTTTMTAGVAAAAMATTTAARYEGRVGGPKRHRCVYMSTRDSTNKCEQVRGEHRGMNKHGGDERARDRCGGYNEHEMSAGCTISTRYK